MATSVSWVNHDKFATARISNFVVNCTLTDCMIIVEGQALLAHKVILSIASKKFEDFFTADKNNKTLILDNVTLDDARMLLELIYGGQTEVPNHRMESFERMAQDFELYGWADIDGMKRNVIKSISKPTPPTPCNVLTADDLSDGQQDDEDERAKKATKEKMLLKCSICGAKTSHRKKLMEHYELVHPKENLNIQKLI